MGHGSASVDGAHGRADFCGLMVWPYASRPWRGSRRLPRPAADGCHRGAGQGRGSETGEARRSRPRRARGPGRSGSHPCCSAGPHCPSSAELTDDGLRQVGGCVTASAGNVVIFHAAAAGAGIADQFRVVMSLETMISCAQVRDELRDNHRARRRTSVDPARCFSRSIRP